MSKEEAREIADRVGLTNRPVLPKNTWISIEEHLPGFLIEDLHQGYSRYKVKNEQGEEFFSQVTDHKVWYYEVKEEGITHWWNGE